MRLESKSVGPSLFPVKSFILYRVLKLALLQNNSTALIVKWFSVKRGIYALPARLLIASPSNY